MSFIGRTWGAALSLVVFSAGASWASCALPGYSLGDAGAASGAGGSGQATSATGESTGSTGAGGMGAGGADTGGGADGTGCTDDADCTKLTKTCVYGFCEKMSDAEGVCVEKQVSDPGQNVKPQAVGDCKIVTCSAQGPTEDSDPMDIDNDHNDCTLDECVGTTVMHKPKNDGSPCSSGATTGFCFAGKCAQCAPGAACDQGEVCINGACYPNSCADQTMNNNESSTDCGGPDCAPCPKGKSCKNALDCATGVCDNGMCAAPSCFDGVKNGEEADKDCGAACSSKCGAGSPCRSAADCADSVCRGGMCQAATCGDWVQNQGETGIDCGPPCEVGCP